LVAPHPDIAPIQDHQIQRPALTAIRQEPMLNYYKRNYPREPYAEDTSPVVKTQMPVLGRSRRWRNRRINLIAVRRPPAPSGLNLDRKVAISAMVRKSA
jgi:hypothetical protein